MYPRQHLAGSALLALLAAGACAPVTTAAPNGPAMAGDTVPVAMATDSARMSKPGVLGDAGIAAIVSATNQAEIRPSQLALQRSTNPAVRQFAQQMITQHGALEQQLLAIRKPEPVPISVGLNDALDTTLQRLTQREGVDFDRLYVTQQRDSHEYALTALDSTLIRGTRDGELKRFLQDRVRPAVAAHLEEVRGIIATLPTIQ